MSRSARVRVALVLGATVVVLALLAAAYAFRPRQELTALVRGGAALLARTEGLIERAAEFDQDAALAALAPNAHNGSYYRFDDHLADASVSQVSETVPASAGRAGRLDFEFDGTDAVHLVPHRGDYVLEDGLLKLVSDGKTYLRTTRAVKLDKDSVGDVELRMRLEQGRSVLLGWGKQAPEANGGTAHLHEELGQIRIDTIPDGDFHTYRIDATTVLRKRMHAGDQIRSVALRPSDVAGDRVEVDYLRFIPKLDEYSAAPVGRSYESLDRELRRVLYVSTPRELVYRVQIPKKRPRLSFGVGILEDGSPDCSATYDVQYGQY